MVNDCILLNQVSSTQISDTVISPLKQKRFCNNFAISVVCKNMVLLNDYPDQRGDRSSARDFGGSYYAPVELSEMAFGAVSKKVVC